ncbi:sugar efflux transporter [Motilimonas pumila]|uniref:MFS transporter n=1 Tax=Motilimonas pumila TaxID=2303987 RepID=A0A418YIT0_9GAMM|nr:sugar efflux transporter [Motilimonas pumila]RJG50527.1 MFS transporter [Motilimonas pumila]
MKQYLYSLFPGHQPDRTTVSLLFTCLFVGIAGSFTVPTMSLFMTQEVGVKPALLGVFFALVAIAGVAVSQTLAWWSDQGKDRKSIILVCNTMGAIGFLVFAFSRDFTVLLISALIFLSTSSASLPQVFALAREVLDKRQQAADKFSAVLRAQIALAWVLGPPLAFFLAEGVGFQWLFIVAALLYVCLLAVVLFTLPSSERERAQQDAVAAPALWRDKDLLALSVAFLAMYAANNMYLISMPLYIATELQLDSALAGFMMGTAALIEIPVMLLSGSYAVRFGKRRLTAAAVVAGVIFYAGVAINESVLGFLCLQLFNGIFIGVTSALGISYFQDLQPAKMGQVTTLYSNSIKTGGILGGVVAGAVAQWFGFNAVFIACAILSVIAFFVVLQVRNA